MEPDRRAPAPNEAGFTLIEVIVTLGIVSIAFVAILTALTAMISTTATHRRITDGETMVRNVAEYVKSQATVPYASCEDTSTPDAAYEAAVDAAAASLGITTRYAADVVTVAPGTGGASFGSCAGGVDVGVQRVTVKVTPTDATAGQQLMIVKRQP